MESSVTPLSSLKGTLVDFVKFSTWIYADYQCKRAFLNQSVGFELQQEGSSGALCNIQRTRFSLFISISQAFPPVLRLECRFGVINLALFVWQHHDSSVKERYTLQSSSEHLFSECEISSPARKV